jgi:hypothetical protein
MAQRGRKKDCPSLPPCGSFSPADAINRLAWAQYLNKLLNDQVFIRQH